MDKPVSLEPQHPRFLRYRSHYKVYLIMALTFGGLILSFWGYRLSMASMSEVYRDFKTEFWLSCFYFFSFGCVYFFWLRSRLNRSVQVYSEHLLIHHFGIKEELKFEDVESVGMVCWSVFYFKMKNGIKHYFSSSLERVDYVWEGFYQKRPDLVTAQEFEAYRLKLVQYDHHQKRKEWFFRHKLLDVFNWVVMPFAFFAICYLVQTRDLIINQPGMYFFRLFMYASLILIITTFMFSIVLKKFVFDKRIQDQLNDRPDDKLRDLEFEGVILHRSKLFQMITATFVFSLLIRSEVNFYSLTKIKENLTSFNLKAGQTLVVDNRFNCIACKHSVKDGDLIVFGKGTIGQVLAYEGEMVGQIMQDKSGRMIASEMVEEVPKGHIAVKLSNKKDLVMVKVEELIGKIQK